MQTTAEVSFEGNSIREFPKGFRSGATKESCTKNLRYLIERIGWGVLAKPTAPLEED